MRISRLFSHQHIRLLLGILVTVLLLAHVVGALNLGFIQAMERFAYDARLQLLTSGGLDDHIVIVDIDEASLKQEGHWPWGRNKLAQLLDRLFDQYQARLVAFDVVFAEKDESSGLAALQAMRQAQFGQRPDIAQLIDAVAPGLDYDQQFADSMRGRNVVLGYYFRHDTRMQHNIGVLPPPVMQADVLAGRDIAYLQASGYGANLPVLQQQAKAAGHFNPDPDEDGITRRIPLLVAYQDGVYEALSLAVARQVLGDVQVTPGFADSMHYAGMEWLELGQRKIPVDANLNALIPYRGKQGSFPYISAADVLHGKVPPQQLQDRIVLIGTTAPGLMDLRATPVQSVYPGVEIHANMIAGILDGSVRQQPAYTLGAEFLLLMLLGVGLSILLPRMRPVPATMLSAAVLSLLVLSNLLSWEIGVVLPLASALLLVALLYVLNMSYGYFIESRSKRHLAQLFGQYVPPELVAEMAARPNQLGLEGESREMTVLFCDVRRFTTISEALDPQTLAKLMNEYLTAMTRVIHQHRGTIDKYMGDAIMAFWGAPLHDEQHAANAVNAALDMARELEKVNAVFQEKGWPAFKIGIGLNTGEMTVGNMGSEFRMAYTVLGDAVNLSARLESLCEYYAEPVIVSEFSVRAATQYPYRELDLIRVKGKDAPIRIYAPIIDEYPEAAQELAQYELALAAYRQQQWQQANTAFKALQTAYGERRIYVLYLERISHFSHHAPEADWDGVYNFESKRGEA
ncbi:CHASE2 domain-containing protein [Methylobacillus sp. Pita1]|uniref:CHASE2 domain-containing protein n=1 Tax=Methylobacillus sp. Pita1 TaxID=3382642 RepID=UPI0038B6899F